MGSSTDRAVASRGLRSPPAKLAGRLTRDAVLLAFAASLWSGTIFGSTSSADDVAPRRSTSRREAAARALAATVTVEAGHTYGAGLLIAPQAGWVVTACHVVEESTTPTITLSDGARLLGKVVERDRTLDLALIRIPPLSRPPPLLGDPLELVPGDLLMAVGCPRHLPFSLSSGTVSYLGRELDGARWLQTDISLNEGNSGGPVVNAEGSVVGISSFILQRAQGLSFALPIDYALERFAPLRAFVSPSRAERFRRWHAGEVKAK